MNQTSPTNDMRNAPVEDNLDRALSDYFKSKMKQPWPAAPAIPTRKPTNEPSVLVAARGTVANADEALRNQPATVGTQRDASSKSRYTLALSVAVLVGSCWALSNGFQPGERVGPATNPSSNGFGVLPDTSAGDPAALKELRKDKAEHGNDGFAPPKIKLP
jgi:hypothetical protein